jgi:hypothetical protein
MKMTLPAYMPMLKSHSTRNHTRVDNIFCSEGLVNAIIKCTTDEAARPARIYNIWDKAFVGTII